MSPLPEVLHWAALDAVARRQALRRPGEAGHEAQLAAVRTIIADVRQRGDAALREATARYDKVRLDALEVEPSEIEAAEAQLSAVQKAALERAIANVERFHAAQRTEPLVVETSPGVVCERHVRPIDAVGLYVPAGTAPLPSTAVMLAVPARLAGCPTRILCTPPRPDGSVDPGVLAAAHRCGVQRVFKLGGAQAIAAMAYGTESVPSVHKLFGPGNSWVTAAKLLVANDPEGAALDLPAGPTEVLVIADDRAHPGFVAADLLAQAEHSVDAHAVLVTTSARLAGAALEEVQRQMRVLRRNDTLERSLAQARCLVVDSVDEALAVANTYAPEHLILQVEEPRRWLPQVTNAGSVFLGPWTPETIGDYCSGTNHVLPTYGFARAYSGLSLHDFQKRITVQELTEAGLRDLGPTAVVLADLEGLDAHANAIQVRLQTKPGGAA